MGKNFIIIGYDEMLVKYILENTEHSIELLVTGFNTNIEYYRSRRSRIKLVYSYNEIEEIENFEGFVFSQLDKYRSSQLKLYKHMSRFTSNYQYKAYKYYSLYNFWRNIFFKEIENVDAVIFTSQNHGDFNEELPRAFAKEKKVEVYTIELLFESSAGGLRGGIKNENRDEFLTIIKNYKLNISESTYYNESCARKIKSKEEYEKKYGNKKGKIIFWSTKIFKKLDREKQKIIISNIRLDKGILTVLKDCCRMTISIFGGELLAEFLTKSVNIRYKDVYSYADKVISYARFKWDYLYLRRNFKKANYSDKYILYALHFEPEASILNRTVMENQLVAIKMLSQLIPNDWFIYVKEHPVQFKINNTIYSYFLSSIHNYRNKFFYKKLNEMGNIKLIDYNLSSKEMMMSSQAVATINGTIALEAAEYKKPAILFGADSTILKYSKDFIKIDSYEDCKSAIENIKKNKSFNYNDLEEVFSQYVVDFNYENMVHILESIVKDIDNRK